MHGVVFQQLFKFIRENHGTQTLDDICNASGINFRLYNSMKSYPDQEIENILKEVCARLNISRDAALETFGEYIGPALIKMYGAYIKKEWGALDLLENIESTIHRTVRMNNPEATPPALKIERTSEKEVVIKYSSERKMIHLGIGIIKSVSKHYNIPLNIKKSMGVGQQILTITSV